MSLKVGLIGLPNVGKSTIFNALTKSFVPSDNFPFCTIEPNHGIVNINDPRLDTISDKISTEKIVPATIEFVDIAGIVQGASKGDGLGNKFLSHIRNVDAIAHVVRCFDSDDITHVDGSLDPIRDIETIKLELTLKDIETLEKRIAKAEKSAKGRDRDAEKELDLLNRVYTELSESSSIPGDLTDSERSILKSFSLLSSKPMMYVANIDEGSITSGNAYLSKLESQAANEGAPVIHLCGSIEMEIAGLEQDERIMFMEEYGIKETGLDRLAMSAYKLLGLETFFTAGPQEIRAWTIPKMTRADDAAGTIHTDFKKGFIKAEIYSISSLVELGSEKEIKNAGKMRLEGKDYVVNDGDVIFFRFNV